MEPSTPTCGTCRHWRRIDVTKGGRNADGGMGECRLNPPHGVRSWPRTQDTDGCAQHKPIKATARQQELLP